MQQKYDESKNKILALSNECMYLKTRYTNLKQFLKPRKNGILLSVSDESDLQCIPGETRNDYTFVRKSILYIYRGTEGIFPSLYLSGTKARFQNDENETNITPSYMKPEIELELRNLFSKRLRRLKLNTQEIETRTKQFSTHLSKSLSNIRKAAKEGKLK